MDPSPRSSTCNTLLVENDLGSVNLEKDLDMSSSSSEQVSTELSAETVTSVHQDDWHDKDHSEDENHIADCIGNLE